MLVRPRGTVLLTAGFGLPLLAMAYAGMWSRYVADDFCTASMLLERGFVGAQVTWYQAWTGRFGAIFTTDLLETLGPWTVPLTPAALIVAWLVATFFALRPLLGDRALVAAPLIVGGTLATAPNLWESLLWQTGALTYVLPLVLATTYVATLQSGWSTVRATGVALLVIAVGCSETAMAVIVTALALAWLVDRRVRPGLVAALVAAAVVVAAPGNAARISFYPATNAPLALAEMLTYPALQLFNFVSRAPAYAALAYAVPFLFPPVSTKLPPRRLIVLGGWLLLAACSAPSYYAMIGLPFDRVLVVSHFATMLLFFALGISDARAMRLPRLALAGVVAALILIGPVLSTVEILQFTPELEAHAAKVDALDRQARQAHGGTLTVAPIARTNLITLTPLGTDPKVFPNECVARYYGLDAIIAR